MASPRTRRIPRRENSFSDSDGQSITSDEEEEFSRPTPAPVSPTRSTRHAESHRNSTSGEAVTGARRPSKDTNMPPPDPLVTNLRTHSRYATRDTAVSAATATSIPRERFRSAVRKVMHLHRTSAKFQLRDVGAEPGVDPRRASAFQQYGHLKQQCIIEICDYSSVRHNFGRMSNESFVQYMQDSKVCAMEDWVKVRWINIGGVSWDVISALALRYDLHPLAIEDILHRPRSGLLSKADYYVKHLFLRILAHSIPSDDEHEHDPLLFGNPITNPSYENVSDSLTGLPRSSSPSDFFRDGKLGPDEEGDEQTTFQGTPKIQRPNAGRTSSVFKRRGTTKFDVESTRQREPELTTGGFKPNFGRRTTAQRQRVRHVQQIEDIKKGNRVNVRIQPFCIFLLRDGTVITLHPYPNLEFTAPIRERLKHRDTGLRSSADPSLLVHAVLDLIVDRTLEVVDVYHAKIIELEHKVLVNPNMKTVRALHTIQADLAQHKRTMEPVKTVVYGLRRYDKDRVAALIADEDRDVDAPVKGFMSHKAKVYLADVMDHMNFVLASMENFSDTTEHLIDYTFNMSSYQMNEVMRRLTLVTIIFLPLTLLTGYFGMNFDPMWAVQQNSDALFWKIAVPVMFVVIVIFCWQDLARMYEHFKRRDRGSHHDARIRRKHH